MLLGLTGGVATGKSTFCRMLSAKHPFVTFDADACVHSLLSQKSEITETVRREFGSAVILPDGAVDRPALRNIVFQNADRRTALESILHPPVRQRWESLRTDSLRNGHDLLADIPLLFETGSNALFEHTILVATSRQTQEQRLAERGLDENTARAMINSQWPISRKIPLATNIVWNDGSKGALEHQANLLLEFLVKT